jgi:Protein of unknown function (DUF2934)
MTTSKRTTRGAGSRPDNGAATPTTAPPQSAAPPSEASSSPPKVRARQRKSPSSPTRASDKISSHTAAGQAPHQPVDRYASIALAAYFRSQHRGFKPGHEMEDWLAAEAEVDQRLRGEVRSSGDSPG